MDKKQSLELCAALSNAKGAPGFEDEVLAVLRRYGEGLGSFREDSLRNLYLSRSGNQGGRPMVQLDAHTDEVAFMVQAVKPNGTLRFTTLGGWVPSNIPAHRVWVQTADGDYIPGVTASKPPHFMSEAERKAQPAVEDMSIDIGASSREEVLRDFRVRMAAPVVPDVTFEYQEKHDLMIGKAFDCRLGCASILRTLDNLRDKTLNVDVTGAFAVQEEMGTRGATVTANTVKPDLAIVFEGCPADDTVAEPYMIQTAIHKGPMLRHIDARMITNPRFQRYALDLAEELGIPVQESVRTGGSTNGAPIHLSNQGVPVIVIGIPVRYIHTHYGIAAHSDVENAARLAAAILERMDAAQISRFRVPKLRPHGGAAFLLIPEKPYHTLSILLLKSAVPPGYLQLIFLLFHTYSRKIAQ